ncbi:nucleotidyltransferase family protein [Marinobacterium aestuariivivens]|uniref:Nucleotidyltransferase family protein n=1 Tax=Marinobacterium aestuariivivens TaxID=1698799 RepID=A0ABW1ZWZ9_9GAMM
MIPLIEQKREQIATACRQHAVSRLRVFGSSVDGRFDDKSSDVDLLVEFEPGLSPAEYSVAFFCLLERLQNILQRNVDLLTINPLRNPYLQASIESSQELLYAA